MANKDKKQQPKPPTAVPVERRHIQYANSVEINSNPGETHILFQVNGPENKGLNGTQVIMPTGLVKGLALMLWTVILQTEKQTGQEFPVPSGLAEAAQQLGKLISQG